MASQDNDWKKVSSRSVEIGDVSIGDHVYMRYGLSRTHGIVVEGPAAIDDGSILYVASPENPRGRPIVSLKEFMAIGGTLCRSGYGCVGWAANIQIHGVAQKFLRAPSDVVVARALTTLSEASNTIDWCISCMAYIPDGSTVRCGREAAIIFTEDNYLVAYVMSASSGSSSANRNNRANSVVRKEPLCSFIKQSTLHIIDEGQSGPRLSEEEAHALHQQLIGVPFGFRPTSTTDAAATAVRGNHNAQPQQQAAAVPFNHFRNVGNAVLWTKLEPIGGSGGTGGSSRFGTVYKGRSSEGLIMAVKVMQVTLVDAKSFSDTIDIVGALAHPNIVCLIDPWMLCPEEEIDEL